MKKSIKVAIVALVVLILGVLIEKHIQPIINQWGCGFFPASNVLMIPFWYYLITLFGWGARYDKFIRLLALFGFGIVFVFVSELFNMDHVYGKIIAYLVGALLTGFYLLIEKAILAYRQPK